jgi:hypothetical protein
MIIYGRGPGQLPRYIARVLYDFSYWSFINLMYLEIIFGLICESFGFLQSKLTDPSTSTRRTSVSSAP